MWRSWRVWKGRVSQCVDRLRYTFSSVLLEECTWCKVGSCERLLTGPSTFHVYCVLSGFLLAHQSWWSGSWGFSRNGVVSNSRPSCCHIPLGQHSCCPMDASWGCRLSPPPERCPCSARPPTPGMGLSSRGLRALVGYSKKRVRRLRASAFRRPLWWEYFLGLRKKLATFGGRQCVGGREEVVQLLQQHLLLQRRVRALHTDCVEGHD